MFDHQKLNYSKEDTKERHKKAFQKWHIVAKHEIYLNNIMQVLENMAAILIWRWNNCN